MSILNIDKRSVLQQWWALLPQQATALDLLKGRGAVFAWKECTAVFTSLKKKKYCANKRFLVTSNLRYMHGVLNVDEIKN
jgi:hypothetical protein